MSTSPKVLVAFYSRDGSTEALANAVAEGARQSGAEVKLARAREVVGPDIMKLAPGWAENAARMNALYPAPTPDDIVWADAVIFGSPTRYGNASSELRAFIDSLGGIWFQGKTANKAASVFTSTSSPHGGNESTLLSLYNTLAHLGMVIVPLGYVDPATFQEGTPYGASHVAGQDNRPPSETALTVARFQGKRTAEVAAALVNGGIVSKR